MTLVIKLVGFFLLILGGYLLYLFGKELYNYGKDDPVDKGFNSQAIWGAVALIFLALYLILK